MADREQIGPDSEQLDDPLANALGEGLLNAKRAQMRQLGCDYADAIVAFWERLDDHAGISHKLVDELTREFALTLIGARDNDEDGEDDREE